MYRAMFSCILILFAGDFAVTVVGQETIRGKPKSLATSCERGWKEVIFRGALVCIPKTLKQAKEKCYEPGCLVFESDDSLLIMHSNKMYPIAEKRYPSFSEKTFTISDFEVWVWSFQSEGDDRRSFGARLQFITESSPSISVAFATKNSKPDETFERIIRSARIQKMPV